MTADPFSEVYDALFDVLVEQHEIERRIVPRSRIRFDGAKPNPIADSVNAGDVPEVMLYPGRGTYNLSKTSTHAQIEQVFHLRIATHDLRLDRDLFPVKWAAMRAIYQASPTLGLDTVKKLEVVDGTDRYDDTEANRGTPGWSTLLSVQVTMFVTRERLASKRGD